METVDTSRASTGKTGAAKTSKKVTTIKELFGKKTVTPRLCNFLSATTIINKEVITE